MKFVVEAACIADWLAILVSEEKKGKILTFSSLIMIYVIMINMLMTRTSSTMWSLLFCNWRKRCPLSAMRTAKIF